MTTLWLGYAMLVGVLVALAAAALEGVLRLARRPARWAWAAAMVAAVVLPFALWLGLAAPVAVGGAGAAIGDLVIADVAAAGGGVAEPTRVPWRERIAAADRWVVPLWAAGSALAASFLLVSRAALQRRRRAWRPAVVAGEAVLVAPDVGPAVVGTLRPRIVLPRRVLEWDDARQALIVAHEREHLHGGDARLLAGALLLLVAMPWNPALWYALRRLRLAVEADCDARVLRGRVDVRSYGALLLEVGGWPRGVPAGAGFAEPRSFLERRLRIMTAPTPKHRTARGAALLVLAAAAVGAACEVPRPVGPTPPAAAAPLAGPSNAVSTEGEAQPYFTPFDVRPELVNRMEVARALEEAYPQMLRDAGTGGTASVWLFVDESGAVTRVRVNRTSGHPQLDDAADRVARQMRFTPAQIEGRSVVAWIQVPITFQVRGAAAAAARVQLHEARVDPSLRAERAAPGEPHFTPFEVRPELRNRTEVTAALRAAYPAMLRDAGLGGTAQVWVNIGTEGVPIATRIASSSGYPQLDAAAEAVVRQMRFSPAENRGERVPVWILIPISFLADEAQGASSPGSSALPSEVEQIRRLLSVHHAELLEAGLPEGQAVWFVLNAEGGVIGTGVDVQDAGLASRIRERHPEAETGRGFGLSMMTPSGRQLRAQWYAVSRSQ